MIIYVCSHHSLVNLQENNGKKNHHFKTNYQICHDLAKPFVIDIIDLCALDSVVYTLDVCFLAFMSCPWYTWPVENSDDFNMTKLWISLILVCTMMAVDKHYTCILSSIL